MTKPRAKTPANQYNLLFFKKVPWYKDTKKSREQAFEVSEYFSIGLKNCFTFD